MPPFLHVRLHYTVTVFTQVVRVEGLCSTVQPTAIPPMDHPL